MKLIKDVVSNFSDSDIDYIEKNGYYKISNKITLTLQDVEISSADVPGFSVATNNEVTVALDITLSEKLTEEGLARDFVNRIQKIRKDFGFEVTDKIKILVEKNPYLINAIKNNFTYICDETLATQLDFEEGMINNGHKIELIDKITANVSILKN